ncbi:MAG: SMP-30/gluconolactonase/LRE family protein [Rhodocyclaceae bacterium]|nr:SMP-30/gluconolactonase/LRE family protein [Rhodocyclaceae bacterium]MBX3670702.1 SMP-30/gluconolactonase/LRE family protein [Rhodocyclaceae bacterium]
MQLRSICCGLLALCAGALSATAHAVPSLVSPTLGTLELVAHDNLGLARIDGLAFDRYGNLFATRETLDSSGGVSYIDRQTGAVSVIASSIKGSDQIAFAPDGALYVTSELSPQPSDVGGTYRLTIQYDAQQRPTGASKQFIATTPTLLNNPEGLVVLDSASAYGSTGSLLIAEDRSGGRILQLDPASGAVVTLVDSGAGLARPEGLAFGRLAGSGTSALYAAITAASRVYRVDADGSMQVLAEAGSAALDLRWPDNLEFGPDGKLYAGEDQAGVPGRILRFGAGGTVEAIATGFLKPQGMAFDASTGDLYIAEQGANSLWRLHFAPVAEPDGTLWAALALAAVFSRRRRGLQTA